MPGFNLTTTPKSLKLKPGETATIAVVVSNALGRPFLARVDADLTPAQAAAWVTAPANAQTQFKADPAATETMQFQLKVPANAVPGDVTFRAKVVEPGRPDDPLELGETVAVEVLAPDAPVEEGGKKVPWWVFLVAGIVLVGGGIGLYLALRSSGVPVVIGKTVDQATAALTKAGFEVVLTQDSLGDGRDTLVVAQMPEAGGKVPDQGTDTATIVINRPSVVIPPVRNRHIAVAIDLLREAGLRPGRTSGRWTSAQAQDDHIADLAPGEGERVVVGREVDLVIYYYSATRPCANPRICAIERASWESQIRTRWVVPNP